MQKLSVCRSHVTITLPSHSHSPLPPCFLFLGRCDYTMGLVMALVSIAIIEAVGFPPSLWNHSSGPATPHLLSLRSGRDIKWTDLLKVLNNLRLERSTDETHGGKRKKLRDSVDRILKKSIEGKMNELMKVKFSCTVGALIFFRLLLSSCLNWKIYCDEHSSLSSTTAVQI